MPTWPSKEDRLKEAVANDGFISIGRGGVSLHFRDGGSLSGYHVCKEIQAAIDAGVYTVDTTTIPEETIHAVILLPVPRVGYPRQPDKTKWHPLEFASPRDWGALAAKLGATIRNE